jgi:hypothetical protein
LFALISVLWIPIFVFSAFAQTQLATITSSGPFQLRGAKVATGGGVPSWPVLAGDVIKTGSSAATVTFPDGSFIVIAPGSEARIELVNQAPLFQLNACAIHYSLKTPGSVQLQVGGAPVSLTDLVGDSKIGTCHVSSGWWTTGHTIAVVGVAGGAAALGVGLTQANPSPSH